MRRRRPRGAEDGRWEMGYRRWEMGTKPLGSGAVDPATAGPRKGRHRLPGGKCRQMGFGNQAARKRRGRSLNLNSRRGMSGKASSKDACMSSIRPRSSVPF